MSNTALYESDSEPEGSGYNDSDEESLVDVDSPADGYFERREHPQTPFIPNPATQPQSEEDKAREAAAERRSQHPQQYAEASGGGDERQRPPSRHSQPRSPVWEANEDTPLLDAGPAGPPPDYAAATADRRSGGHGREGSYGSISDSAFSSDHPLVRNGLTNEQGVFGQQRSEPQSMRDSLASSRSGLRGGGGAGEGEEGAADEERGFVRRQWGRDWNGRRRWTRHFRAKRWFTWLVVLGILVFILTVSGAFGDAQENGSYPSDGNGRQKPESPAQPGNGGGGGSNGDKPSDPTKDSPMPPHKSSSRCQWTSFSTPERVGFASPANFSLVEFIENPVERAFFNGHITGTIQVSAAPATQSEAIVVWISVAISGLMEFERLRKVSSVDALELLFPDVRGLVNEKVDGAGRDLGRWAGNEGNCLDFSVAVLVKPGMKLGNLELGTANFDVKIEEGVFADEHVEAMAKTPDVISSGDMTTGAFANVDHAEITAVRGKIHADYFSSRETYVYGTSSRISGSWALRDLLYVESSSGAIDISVDPKKASDKDPEHPAEFHCKSKSGDVEVGYLTDGVGGDAIPDRDYHTRVETTSAKIKGSYILGSNARFDTFSGTVDVRVLPYYADRASALHTSTLSAETKLKVLAPYKSAEKESIQKPRAGVLGNLHSAHKSTSGALKLVYPDEWEGVIEGQSVSGGIRVRGDGVKIVLDKDLGRGIPSSRALRHVVARKGDGGSRMGFETTSGSVDVVVGQV